MIKAAIVVKRIPQITRNLDKLSHAYYLLKNTEEQDQARPFEPEFYFKKGSIGEVKWNQENLGKKGAEIKQPQETSQTRDIKKEESVHSLNRKLEENLYLVKKVNDSWEFPEMEVETEEFLHETSDRLVKNTLGDLDVWRVGQAPIGHLERTFFMKYHVLYQNKSDESSKFSKDGEVSWLDKDECKSRMAPSYYNGIQDML